MAPKPKDANLLDAEYAERTAAAKSQRQVWHCAPVAYDELESLLNHITAQGGYVFDVVSNGIPRAFIAIWYEFIND